MIIENGPAKNADGPTQSLWVNPVYVEALAANDFVDFSGLSAVVATRFNCSRWTVTGDTGLVFFDAGGDVFTFGLGNCNISRPAACCN